MTTEIPRRLGRGLEALISNAARPAAPASSDSPPAPPSDRVPIASIKPNPFQPRRTFNPADLKELEESLKTTGLLQPITLRKSPSGAGFELAAGERRLRAATNLGWIDIPAVIKNLTDQELLAVALVENLQRADLNPIEEAQGYARLLSEFGQTQQSVATMVGKERSTVANMLRLLQLPSNVIAMVQSSSLSLGHARALLGLPSEDEMIALANSALAEGLSVREVERRVRVRKPTPNPVSGKRTAPPKPKASSADGNISAITDKLRRKLQTDVRMGLTGPDRGSISIAFYSADDLERLLDILLGPDRHIH